MLIPGARLDILIFSPRLPEPPDTAMDPPLTPLYDSLTTNIPHPVMAFGSHPFPPETPLFPDAERVLDYLKDFASHFSLRPHIKFFARVTSITYAPKLNRHWLVQTSTNESYYFDLIMVCNGHYRVPRFPSVSGLSDWQDARKVLHSVYYRRPLPVYKKKTLLIVGHGPSGYDLSYYLNGYASKVIFSGSSFETCIDPNGLHLRPCIVSFGSPSTGTVTFADGTVDDGVDYCILATGYSLDIPFLQPPLIRHEYPAPMPSLPKDVYNSSYSVFALAQHLWPLQTHFPPETMAFLGLLFRVAPFPLMEVQARATLRAFETYARGLESNNGTRGIDEQAEAVEIAARWEKLKAKEGDESTVIKVWHRFEETEQFDYRDHLSSFAETDQLSQHEKQGPAGQNEVIRSQEWEKYGYHHKVILRSTWVKIEKDGEAEKWLKDVGANGIYDWINLMHRIVAYGQELARREEEE